METNFTCYTKKIEGEVFYFVKKFIVFPEFGSVTPLLESYGMHTEFDKACAIANLYDASIKKQLLEEIETGVRQAKVIDLSEISFNNQRPAMGM